MKRVNFQWSSILNCGASHFASVSNHLQPLLLLCMKGFILPKGENKPCHTFQKALNRASDISRKKKQNFAGFSGANSRKNRLISRDCRGRKVKIRRKIVRFRGTLAEKSQISKDFQEQILRKIGRFHGKFRGETSPRNNQ